MAETVGAAPLQRLPDRRQPERLAGVNGEVRILAAQIFERVQVTGGRETGFRAGDVEAGDLVIAKLHRQIGDLPGSRRVAHGGQQSTDADRISGGRRRRAAGGEPVEHSPDDFGQRQSFFHVQLRCEAHFRVDHPVSGKVLSTLRSDPDQ